MKITSFRDNYFFLSNFYPAPVVFEGAIYRTAEHAYQAAKTDSAALRYKISRLATPALAKRQGRCMGRYRRKDWDSIKLDAMLAIVKSKFKNNSAIRQALLETDNAELVEHNTWGDEFWGVYQGTGQNHLGKILMRVREELKAGA